ncbi:MULTISPECIES: 4'-phosphopantetheinyl transferase superfamily protein [Arthrobacter]|uniref:4'-phosphopantetheinyl transferase superfamily protein n=1 Tax=Arthrobacter terricola TaxID=2547396 RepID=A0A4R5KZ94_9MICC|nr:MULTISPECIES: 4'-phosphopantetheinyl transferase family protein [Arthrobacter]MBT8160217.1 4'-phosphopantetheinyl transferase superfamily protein [Arthrobacter sp. GN70]TDG01207.1 4'-phosphopantetheinyl transferase superfamily protein [Arthrobacter terricola]
MAAELLSSAEIARADSMATAPRFEFLASRVAQQRFAAGLLGVPATKLTAAYECPQCGAGPDIAHGRPGYLLDGDAAPLLLSASRASGWVLFAAVVRPGKGLRLGADLESVAATEFVGFDEVALTANERRHLASMEPGLSPRERARLWARKEAWLKMTGEGLRVRPDSLDVLDKPGLHDYESSSNQKPFSNQEPFRNIPSGFVAALAIGTGAVPR